MIIIALVGDNTSDKTLRKAISLLRLLSNVNKTLHHLQQQLFLFLFILGQALKTPLQLQILFIVVFKRYLITVCMIETAYLGQNIHVVLVGDFYVLSNISVVIGQFEGDNKNISKPALYPLSYLGSW